jgi:hypothetical protein
MKKSERLGIKKEAAKKKKRRRKAESKAHWV